MSNYISSIIFAVAIIVAVFLFNSLVVSRIITKADKYLEITAINDCQTIARYQRTIAEENAVVYYPIQDQYESCMKLKGY